MRLHVPKLRFHLHRGLDIPLAGPPRTEIHAAPQVRSVALLTGDYPSIKPVLLVEEGSRVKLGEPLMQDRADPRLRLVSPGAGVVKTIHRGAKRALRSVVVQLEGEDQISFEPVPAAKLAELSPEFVLRRWNPRKSDGKWGTGHRNPTSKLRRQEQTGVEHGVPGEVRVDATGAGADTRSSGEFAEGPTTQRRIRLWISRKNS